MTSKISINKGYRYNSTAGRFIGRNLQIYFKTLFISTKSTICAKLLILKAFKL
jgi:hypothetical protein